MQDVCSAKAEENYVEEPRRFRVLLSAFSIAPNQGSEAGVGWNTAIRLAEHHDVTVLCGDLGAGRTTEKAILEHFRVNGAIHGLSICYVAPSAVTRALYWLCGRPGLGLLYYSAYHSWQRDAYRIASALLKQTPYDIIHQLTFASFREPGYLWRLRPQFFWGPIGGASSPPLRMVLRGGARLVARHIANVLQKRLSRRSAMAARKAVITWVSTEEDARLLRNWGARVRQQFEVGTSNIRANARVRTPGSPFRLVWSGLHIRRKALPLALCAMARLPQEFDIHLHIVGSGPETQKCQALARHLQIDRLVTWHGRLDQKDAVGIMEGVHALLHTSISEGTPAVILEALAAGLPVVCHDICGMHLAVTDECGIRVPLRNRQKSIEWFAEALLRLRDVAYYNRLSEGALQRADELTWDNKVAQMSSEYATVIAPE